MLAIVAGTAERRSMNLGSGPAPALVLVGLLFVAAAVPRLLIGGTRDNLSGLYSIPIAVAALRFGRRGGLAGAAVATALFVASIDLKHVHFTALGWATRLLPLLVLGLVVGIVTDRLRHAVRREHVLAARAERRKEAAEVNDSVVQGLVVAKWYLEVGQPDAGLVAVTDALSSAQHLVSDLLGEDDSVPGSFRRSRSAGSGPG